MFPPKTGMRVVCEAEVPMAIQTLPPLCTYFKSSLSNAAGTEITSERTTKAYLERGSPAACATLAVSSVKPESAVEARAARKYTGERESPASYTKSTRRGSVRSTAKMLESSAGNASEESMRTSQRVKP